MKTKELLDEYKELTIKVYDAERNDYWDKEVKNQKNRIEEIIQELETSIRKEVVGDILELGKVHGGIYDATWEAKIKNYALSKGIN